MLRLLRITIAESSDKNVIEDTQYDFFRESGLNALIYSLAKKMQKKELCII